MKEQFSGTESKHAERLSATEEGEWPKEIYNDEQKREFDEVIVSLQGLYEEIERLHKRNEDMDFTSEGHSLEHDLAVAMFAHAIGRCYSPSLARNSVAAALVHSYDRLIASPLESKEKFKEEDVQHWVEHHLPDIPKHEQVEVIKAATRHDKPNRGRKTDNPTVADVLQDADKLASLMLYSIIRFGQNKPDKPAARVGYMDRFTPGASYKRHNVAFDDVFGVEEWVDDLSWFVTPESKLTAEVLKVDYKDYIRRSKRQFDKLGLIFTPEKRQ